LGDVGYLIDLGEEFVGLKGLGQIDDGLFSVVNEIGIVGDPLLADRPQTLEEIGSPIVDPDPVAIRFDLNNCHQLPSLRKNAPFSIG
jgi:hypothetical protein